MLAATRPLKGVGTPIRDCPGGSPACGSNPTPSPVTMGVHGPFSYLHPNTGMARFHDELRVPEYPGLEAQN
jgi:hypothetical protein